MSTLKCLLAIATMMAMLLEKTTEETQKAVILAQRYHAQKKKIAAEWRIKLLQLCSRIEATFGTYEVSYDTSCIMSVVYWNT